MNAFMWVAAIICAAIFLVLPWMAFCAIFGRSKDDEIRVEWRVD